MRKTEEDIVKEATIKHFESQGFECAREISGFGERRPDVIAWNKMTNTLYAVECKGSGVSSLYQAMGQALPYKAMAHEVFVSVPDKTWNDKNLDRDFLQDQCNKTSLNVLFFDLKTQSLTNVIESISKNTEFKRTLIEKLRKKFQRGYWVYDVFDEHPEYYREIVRILYGLGGSGTTGEVFQEFRKLKGKGTNSFRKKYPYMRKTGGYGIVKKSYIDALLNSSKTLELILQENGSWKLTPVGMVLLQNINPTKGDALNKDEELIFRVLAFKPVLSKEIYEIVKKNPDISKKNLSKELGKILPKYGLKHEPSWFVDRLSLFLSNCGILQKQRRKAGNVYRVRI